MVSDFCQLPFKVLLILLRNPYPSRSVSAQTLTQILSHSSWLNLWWPVLLSCLPARYSVWEHWGAPRFCTLFLTSRQNALLCLCFAPIPPTSSIGFPTGAHFSVCLKKSHQAVTLGYCYVRHVPVWQHKSLLVISFPSVCLLKSLVSNLLLVNPCMLMSACCVLASPVIIIINVILCIIPYLSVSLA